MQCCILPMQEMKTWSPRAKMSLWLSSSSPRGINSQFEKLQDGVTCATLMTQQNDLQSTHINRVMLQHWWANADLQIIFDIWACARYVANYASKDDPRSPAAVAALALSCWCAADMLLTCCCHRVRSISWLYRSASELPDTVYVASTRMQTTVTYTITKNQTCTCTWSNFPRGECMNLTAQVWHTQLQHLEADAKWMQLEQFLSQ